MQEIQTFNNKELGTIRTVMINDEPWFVGKDVSDILGYQNGSRDINRHVDDEDKQNYQNGTFNSPRGMIIINESGLYSLILSSKLPSAKQFKHWVASEVLPSIRKHGVFAVDEVLENPDMLISALQELKKERKEKQELQKTVTKQDKQILEMKPKANYYDIVLNCKDLVVILVIAKDYGWTAKQMNQYLHDNHIQYKRNNTWLLYKKYAEMGLASSKTYAGKNSKGYRYVGYCTCWTPKGRLFIYELLKKNGILPIVERE